MAGAYERIARRHKLVADKSVRAETLVALCELDGERYHMDRETFQRDRAKQNRVHALGWTVYRFT